MAMTRRLVCILVVIAMLLTAFSFALSRRDSRDWRANRSRRLLSFPWQDVIAVTITRHDGQTLRCRREPGTEWKVELGSGRFDVLDSRVSDSLAAFATLTWREPAPDRLPPNPGESVSLVAENSFGQEIRLDFGEVQNSIRSVIVDGDESVVYGVNQDLLSILDWKEDQLRNMYLASVYGGRSPERIFLSPQPGDSSLDVVLEKRFGGWVLSQPVEWPADKVKVDLLLRWLDRLRADSVASEAPVERTSFGLRQPTARIEAIFSTPEGLVRRKIDFGGTFEAGNLYASVDGREPVFTMPKDSLVEISMNLAATHPDLWRNFYRKRSVDMIGGTTPVAFHIERLLPTRSVLEIKKGEPVGDNGSEWTAELQDGKNVHRFSVEPPVSIRRDSPLRVLVSGLKNIRIQTFLADKPPEMEARVPEWRISCTFADGTESPVLTMHTADASDKVGIGVDVPDAHVQTERIGQKKVLFTLSNHPAALEAYAQDAEKLCLPLYKYRSRRLLRIDARHITKVALKSPTRESVYFRQPGDVNDQWWINPDASEPLMDDSNRFIAMLEKLSGLETRAFVADEHADMSEFGLDRPTITAIVYYPSVSTENTSSEPDKILTLHVGNTVAKSQDRYARLNNEGPVFLVPESMMKILVAEYR